MSELTFKQRDSGISVLYDDHAVQRQVLFVSTNARYGSALSLRYRLFVFTGAGKPAQIEDAYRTWSAQ